MVAIRSFSFQNAHLEPSRGRLLYAFLALMFFWFVIGGWESFYKNTKLVLGNDAVNPGRMNITCTKERLIYSKHMAYCLCQTVKRRKEAETLSISAQICKPFGNSWLAEDVIPGTTYCVIPIESVLEIYNGSSLQYLGKDNRKQQRLEKIVKSRCLLEEGELDGLIVCSKFHPTPIVMSLLDFVAPSRPLAVFCQYKEPLLDCFQKLRDLGGIIMLQVVETWFREYQVLSERTHPKLNMSGGGGYLLTATVTERT